MAAFVWFICLFAWMKSVPIYGVAASEWAAAQGLTSGGFSLIFMGAHGAGLLVFGWLMDRNRATVRLALPVAPLICAVLTSLLIEIGPKSSAALFAVMGLVSAAGVIAWMSSFRIYFPSGRRGLYFGVVASLLTAVVWGLNNLAGRISPETLLLTSATICGFGLPAGWILYRTGRSSESGDAPRGQTAGIEPWRRLFKYGVVLLFVYLVGGITYQVMLPSLGQYPLLTTTYALVPFILMAPLAGWVADRFRLRLLLHIGAACLALSFVVWAAQDGYWTAWLAVTFNDLGYAFLEPFIWLYVATYAPMQRIGIFSGVGLNLSVLPILLGAGLSLPPAMATPERAGLLASVAVTLAVVILSLLPDKSADIGKKTDQFPVERLDPEQEANMIRMRLQNLAQGKLTPRELEVGMLALQDLAVVEIAEQLTLSVNTVKTHLRNIYRKTGVKSKHELFRGVIGEEGRSPFSIQSSGRV